MYKRKIEKELLAAAKSYPVVAVLGPRQAGKTTSVKSAFPHYNYVLLEEIDMREFAISDPKGFLEFYRNDHGLIIDEAQHAPDLFSYIQGIVDKENIPGRFILTGSQNFLLNQKISQTLAGRTCILTLLPFSIEELEQYERLPKRYESLIFQGCYPRIHFQDFDPKKWYQNYITTFVEKDIRQIHNILDLHLFQKFIAVCAGRSGQLINWSDIARDCGITTKTVHSWISLLEASYVVFLLQPYFENFNKRLVKSAKLYFYDTGLVCSLLRIQSEHELANHYLKGPLFETLVISEIMKFYLNQGLKPNLYFWRDKVGLEVDCLIDHGVDVIPVEIKSSRTINSDYFNSLVKWNLLSNKNPSNSLLIYGGEENQKRTNGRVIGWSRISRELTNIS